MANGPKFVENAKSVTVTKDGKVDNHLSEVATEILNAQQDKETDRKNLMKFKKYDLVMTIQELEMRIESLEEANEDVHSESQRYFTQLKKWERECENIKKRLDASILETKEMEKRVSVADKAIVELGHVVVNQSIRIFKYEMENK